MEFETGVGRLGQVEFEVGIRSPVEFEVGIRSPVEFELGLVEGSVEVEETVEVVR